MNSQKKSNEKILILNPGQLFEQLRVELRLATSKLGFPFQESARYSPESEIQLANRK